MEILYEDSRIAVCIKPPGVLSTDEPGGMPELLRTQLKTACIRTVHRLDRVTGGIMVFARSRMAASILSEQVRSGTLQKEYLAVLHGAPPESSGLLTDLLLRDRQENITRVVSEPGKDVQQAALSYTVLETAGQLTLVRIRLLTGRTHQIRAQFSSRGLPLWGDRKYGSPVENAYPALFACKLSFLHPQTQTPMQFSASPPDSDPWTLFSAAEAAL